MINTFKNIIVLCFSLALIFTLANCGGSSSSGTSADAVTIQGTLKTSTNSTRALGAGDGGIANVTVSALGDSQLTDQYGNFTLTADGNAFAGGAVVFTLSGNGVDTTAVFDKVAGGPGATAYIDMSLEDDGSITGTSMDASGNKLSEITSKASLGCTRSLSFVDGGGGHLWKPISESTGTVVILMPGDYRNAEFSIVDKNGKSVANVLKRHCCAHNGGRDHVYLDRSASALQAEALPLTVRYEFSATSVDCLEVATPTWRLD